MVPVLPLGKMLLCGAEPTEKPHPRGSLISLCMGGWSVLKLSATLFPTDPCQEWLALE